MNPDDRKLSQGGGEPHSSDSVNSQNTQNPAVRAAPPIKPPLRDFSVGAQQREAATNVIRGTIDRLYSGEPEPAPQPVVAQQSNESPNPYLRTHEAAVTTEAEQWKAYHTAWQDYYQKYYESYYHHAAKTQQPPQQKQADPQREGYFAATEQPAATPVANDEEIITKEEALLDLRSKLTARVTESAKKVRRSRHFVPILAGVLIVLLFVFIQYNKVFVGTVMAYVSPGSLDVQNVVIDPSASVEVAPEPLLIIPKINVSVPVQYDVGNDYNSQMAAMQGGVAHFAIPGASSHPGEMGNTVIAGHSSNDLFDGGDYKFIFAQLEKLAEGDTIYANYKGIRYTYVITKTEVVSPDNVQALVYPTEKPILTLVTCTPLGTSRDRLLVVAEQVSPDPNAAAKPADTTAPSGEATTISGANTPSLFERLLGQ